MDKSRLEAFSDGVIAIIITIMVLEMKVPRSDKVNSLIPLLPVFISYLLSFIYVGIYWNNHHHLMYAARSINGVTLWANLHLLFWLSLVPFVTGWMGENNFTKWPIAFYGLVLLMAAVAYSILTRVLVLHHGKNSELAAAVGKDSKGKSSVLIYAAAITLSFINAWISFALYILVAAIWFLPDKRIEKKIVNKEV